MNDRNIARVIDFPPADTEARPFFACLPMRAHLLKICDDGTLLVQTTSPDVCACDWLESGTSTMQPLAVGDPLLVLPGIEGSRGVVLGRIARYAKVPVTANLRLEATASITLKCGQSSIDLRADGKVLIKGDDVLVRAKGTKRIRAGTVSIN
jgi:hypothetical protein